MQEEIVEYEVEYTYYQYNSGQSDNGNYRKRIRVESEAEALRLAEKINVAAASGESTEPEDGEQRLEHRLIWGDGYFTGASAWKVERRRLEAAPAPVIKT